MSGRIPMGQDGVVYEKQLKKQRKRRSFVTIWLGGAMGYRVYYKAYCDVPGCEGKGDDTAVQPIGFAAARTMRPLKNGDVMRPFPPPRIKRFGHGTPRRHWSGIPLGGFRA